VESWKAIDLANDVFHFNGECGVWVRHLAANARVMTNSGVFRLE